MRRVTVKASGCVGSSSSLLIGGNCNVSTTNASIPDQGGGRREFHSTPVALCGKKVGAATSSSSISTTATPTRGVKKGRSSVDGGSVEIGESDTTKKKKIGKQKKKKKEEGESGVMKKGGDDDDGFDIDRIMATLFKASSSSKDGGVSSSEVLNLDAFLQNGSELERAGSSFAQAGSETAAAADEETEFDNMEKMMRELNFENARKINGAHLLQYIPNETASGAPAEPPFPVMELLVHSEGNGPSRQACLPLQILEPHSTETLKKKASRNSKRDTTTTPPSAQIDSYISPVNVMPTTENFSPLPDAAAVENDMLHPSVSSLPMEYFNEPCFQSYLQRFVYPHLNGFSKATKAGYLKGTINPVDVALMEHRKNNAEVPARLCRDRFPYTANMNTTTSKNIPRNRRQRGSAAQDEDSVDGDTVAIAPQPPGSISLLPSTMIHSTVDWSIPIFHRLQNTILYSEHLRGSSPHILPSTLPERPSSSSTSGLSLMVEKEASLLNQAFLDLVDLAKSVWSEADIKASGAKKNGVNTTTIPSVLDEAIYEFVIRLYYGTVAPARIGALNTEFVDPRAQKRQRLLSPLEACRLLVEPQDLPSSVFNELDELEIANYNSTSLESSVSPSTPPPPHYHRHRDPHDVTTSFTLVRERVVVEPEVEGVTSVDHAISHVRRMAQVSAREDEGALRADNVFSSPPPEEVRGEDGRLTNEYLQRYTKWHEEQAEMMKVSEEERTKILADTEAVEAMRELLKVRQLERLREKTKALGAKSKRQQAELKAIYKLSPEEVLAKYGTLFPLGSTPVVLRKYELLFGKKSPPAPEGDITENTNSTEKPVILSNSNVIPTITGGDQGSDPKTDTTSGTTNANTTASPSQQQQHHTGSDVRTKTTREGIYAFFYSTQPELKSNRWDVARPAYEARLVAFLRDSVISNIREAVISWRAQGEMPWESSNPTLLGARNPEMLVSPMVAATSAESSPSTLSSTGERGYGDVPYMSDAETTRAESAASGLPAKVQSTGAFTPTYVQYPALSHLVSSLVPDHSKRVVTSNPTPSSFTMPQLKEATEIVGRLKGFDWKSKAGRLVSKDGDVIHQSPVGQHRAYLTFCAAATFSNAGQSTHDGVCLSITDPYCHGCQRAVTPAETTGSAVSGPTGRIIEDKVWVPEHCSLDKAIAEDFKASAQERDSQRPLPPAFRK